MRRLCFGLLAALLFFPVSMMSVLAAQDATPESAFTDLGLPTLDVTATASEFQGLPEQLEAGRYLLTLTAESDVEFGAAIEFIQPSEVSADEFVAFLSGPPEETGAEVVADGTPLPGDFATPADDVEVAPAGEIGASPAAEGEEMGGPPSFYFTSTFAGGVAAMAGASAQVVLDLPPGEWVAWSGDPEGQQAPVIFEVTGEMPTDLPEPEADAAIVMGEYVIEITEGELTAGSQIVRVDNIGAQPHFIVWFRGPDGFTEEQVQVVLDEEMEAEMTGTPAAFSDLNPEEDFEFITFTGTQSIGTSQWITVDLEPGTYGLVCFFPDMADGLPHAYKGMYTVVEVGE